MSEALYNEPTVYQASVYFDDGNYPNADSGPSEDFANLDIAKRWAREKVRIEEDRNPAGPEAVGWYALIERGHYERTGSTGFDEFDCDWVSDDDWGRADDFAGDPIFAPQYGEGAYRR